MTHPGKQALEANRSEINEIFANLTSKERKTLRMYISKPELDSIAKYVAELEEALSGKTMYNELENLRAKKHAEHVALESVLISEEQDCTIARIYKPLSEGNRKRLLALLSDIDKQSGH